MLRGQKNQPPTPAVRAPVQQESSKRTTVSLEKQKAPLSSGLQTSQADVLIMKLQSKPTTFSVAPDSHFEESLEPSSQNSRPLSVAKKILVEKFVDERWAVLGVLLTGILICLYCIYQILFSGN